MLTQQEVKVYFQRDKAVLSLCTFPDSRVYTAFANLKDSWGYTRPNGTGFVVVNLMKILGI